VPTPVVGLQSGVREISAGGNHTCALTEDGQAWCFGLNYRGQLGDGSTTDRAIPVSVAGIPDPLVSIASGAVHTCALTDRGGVWCWGGNRFGQVGDGSNKDRTKPVQVPGLGAGVAQISVGDSHSCALTTLGGVWCWGENTYGQIGDGTREDRPLPSAIVHLRAGVTALATGFGHTCGISDGGAVCWGRNDLGQVGSGSDQFAITNPEPVIGLSNNVTRIAAGSNGTCAIDQGALLCWGDSLPRRTDRDPYSASQPILVPEFPNGVTSMATSSSFHCAVRNDTIYCWGYNDFGQLGQGNTDRSLTPVPILFSN
jgi:alpha-tubulin suppressor-like RCC1 family protein